jgi:hypothetical protein
MDSLGDTYFAGKAPKVKVIVGTGLGATND